MSPRRYVLLDRDGTIIKECDYLCDPERVELLPGAVEGLRALRRLGLGLLVVSNQSGLGRGYFQQTDLEAVHARLERLLAVVDIQLDGFYYCPHRPDEACGCRKPAPGLIARAAAEHGFEPSQCFVIGDKRCDVELGQAVGAVSILVRTGYGREHETRSGPAPHQVVDDLEQAARFIAGLLGQDQQ